MIVVVRFIQPDGLVWDKDYKYMVQSNHQDLVRTAGVGGALYSITHHKPVVIVSYADQGSAVRMISLRRCTKEQEEAVQKHRTPENWYTVRANLSVPCEDGVCRQRMGVLVHPMYEDFLRRALENHTLVMCEGQKVYIMSLSRTIGGARSYDRAQYPHFERVKEAGRWRPFSELQAEELDRQIHQVVVDKLTHQAHQLKIDLEAGGVPLRVWAPMDWHSWFKERVGKEIIFNFPENPKQVSHRAKVADVGISPREELLPRIQPVASSAQDERGCTTVSLNTQPQQEKTVNSKIKIENITFINGKPVDQHTVEDVVALIERSNAAIEKMEAFLEKVPSETVKELLSREKHVRDGLVALLDSGQLKEA